MLELPSYRMPHPRDLLLGLWERAGIFLKRVGGIILALTILLWFLLSFPGAPAGAAGPAIDYSFAGRIGHAMTAVFAPMGFNWQICIALIPGMAAREVVVSSLATVYALSAADDAAARRRCADHQRQLVAGDRAVAAGVVHLCAAVPVDAGYDPARDQFVEAGRDQRRISVRAGVPGVAADVPGRESTGMSTPMNLSLLAQYIVIALAVMLSAGYVMKKQWPEQLRARGLFARCRWCARVGRHGCAASAGSSPPHRDCGRGWVWRLRRLRSTAS